MISDISELEALSAQQAEKVCELISRNANMVQDQAAYDAEYDALAQQYGEANAKLTCGQGFYTALGRIVPSNHLPLDKVRKIAAFRNQLIVIAGFCDLATFKHDDLVGLFDCG